jgi:hypothetical protein
MAADTIHWLNAKDVLKSTNGPANVYYEYVVERTTPVFFSGYLSRDKLKNMTPKERLRAHVATVYLDNEEAFYYFENNYPNAIKSDPSI